MKHQRTLLALALIGSMIDFSIASEKTTSPSRRSDKPAYINPAIAKYGKVVKLPDAVISLAKEAKSSSM